MKKTLKRCAITLLAMLIAISMSMGAAFAEGEEPVQAEPTEAVENVEASDTNEQNPEATDTDPGVVATADTNVDAANPENAADTNTENTDPTANTDTVERIGGIPVSDAVAYGKYGDNISWILSNIEGGSLKLTFSGSGKLDKLMDVERPWDPYADDIKSVVIGEGITGIGGTYLFSNLKNLTDASIPGSATETGVASFSCCFNLKNVTIGYGVTKIGANFLQSCRGITKVNLPSTVTEIGPAAFDDCTGIKTLDWIPDSVTTIDTLAFANCSGLTSVRLPASITSIAGDTFHNCDRIKSFYFAGSEEQLMKANGNIGWMSPVIIDYGIKPAVKPTTSTTSSSATTTLKNTTSTKTTTTTKATTTTKTTITTKAKAKTTKITLKAPTLKYKRYKRKNKLMWSKVSNATGYQIYIKYPGKKSYKKALTKSAKVKSVTHKGLKRGKVYYYKIRAYKKVGNKYYYSPFSKVIRVKVK